MPLLLPSDQRFDYGLPPQLESGVVNLLNALVPGIENVPALVSDDGIGFLSRVSLASKGINPGRAVEDAAVTNGSPLVSSATASFDGSDVGSLFTLCDAVDYTKRLSGTILSVQSATQATLSVSSTFTATLCGLALGRDNASAIAAATSSLSVSNKHSTLWVPEGLWLTSTAWAVNDGHSVEGAGRSYGWAQYPNGAGSTVMLAANLGASSRFFTLGNNGSGISAGTTASVLANMSIDAASNADTSVRTLCRRARVLHAAIWRGRADTLLSNAQNSVYIDITACAHNIGNVMQITAADTKVFGGEIRQGGAASFQAATGHQIYIPNPSNVLIEGVHMYSGAFSVVADTAQGANVMIRKTDASAGGNVTIVGCEMDATYGPYVAIRNEGASRLHGIQVHSNQCFTVSGNEDNRNAIVELMPVAGSIRGVSVCNNFGIHNVGGRRFRALVSMQNLDGTTTGLAGALTHTTVRNNTAISCAATSLNFVPESRGGNVLNTVSTTDVLLDENTGRATLNGTGAQTAFTIAHGLCAAPTSMTVTAGTAVASAAYSVTADATNVTVTYAAAPAAGTGNVVLNWSAKV